MIADGSFRLFHVLRSGSMRSTEAWPWTVWMSACHCARHDKGKQRVGHWRIVDDRIAELRPPWPHLSHREKIETRITQYSFNYHSYSAQSLRNKKSARKIRGFQTEQFYITVALDDSFLAILRQPRNSCTTSPPGEASALCTRMDLRFSR